MNQFFSKNLQSHSHYTAFLRIAKQLQNHGLICWIAGGAVRDILLSRKVSDFDLVTNAELADLKKIFPDAVMVGASFGVLKVAEINDNQENIFFDLAILRKEYEYTDGRRPSRVTVGTALEDAERRDFTINALYWDEQNQQIVDLVGGLEDLNKKQIVCVGQPGQRFLEDHLRVLRLLRFHVQLQFSMQDATLQAALSCVPFLEKISGERIWDEFKKIAAARNYQMFFSKDQASDVKTNLGLQVLAQVFTIQNEAIFINQSLNAKLDMFQATMVDEKTQNLMLFYYWLLNSLNDEANIKSVLKNRLHASRKELGLFVNICYVKNHLLSISAEEVFIQIEKEPVLWPIVCFLYELSEINPDTFKKIKNLMDNKSAPMVTANDIKSWMPAYKIAAALQEARLRQIQGVILTKESGIQYLRRWLES